jgi:hypothetical protein
MSKNRKTENVVFYVSISYRKNTTPFFITTAKITFTQISETMDL